MSSSQPQKTAQASPEPKGASPALPETQLMPAEHWTTRPVPEVQPEDEIGDNDSALGDDAASSTASLTSSILAYRTINGRTYHSDRGNADYWASNDEKQNEVMDMSHHLHLLVNKNQLYRAPIPKDIKSVLDVGTGTGIWAIDMADEFPDAEIIGTDVSPIQPSWVPQNVKFVIEDCTQDWTFADNTFDYIHLRYLVGSIPDWEHLMREAYRCLKPGGWIETSDGASHETSGPTVKPGMAMYDFGRIFVELGLKTGRSFTVVQDRLQEKSVRAAGFTDIDQVDFQIPIGAWPDKNTEPELHELGRWGHAVFTSDLEGFLGLPCNMLMGWGQAEVQVFSAHLRQESRSKKNHWALSWRVLWGRKPLDA